MPYRELSDDQLEANIKNLQDKKIQGKGKISQTVIKELIRLNRIKSSREFRRKDKSQKETVIQQKVHEVDQAREIEKLINKIMFLKEDISGMDEREKDYIEREE